MANPIVRWQIISPDPDLTSTFYKELFGWVTERSNAMGYREVKTGVVPKKPLDGGIWPAPAGQGPMVQLFIEVEDVGVCVEKATGLGARVIIPKSVLPDGDTMAVLLDPTGLAFGVCSLRS